ncbi:MAG: carbohydrate-binding domain-containing protein [Sphaerochaetaceae bacterium]|nr:carbohydrate-binding domain-containing protein [Sphaerochaetaceae bacterium]
MKTKKITIILSLLLAAVFALSAMGGSEKAITTTTTSAATTASTGTAASVSGAIYTADDLFSDRDMSQTADLSEAQYMTAESGKDITITSAGVYVISGTAKETTIIVDTASEDKVQLVLDGLSITNKDFPCIYVKSADKVFVTTTDSVNSLSVTGSFTSDGDTNTDAVIFSKDDLTVNGVGTLKISSTDNGITSKDDLKVTGGTVSISCTSDAIEANDSIRIAGGDISITSKKDGLHAEYDEDDSVGFIYICGGTLSVTASDDAIHATTVVQIDGGEISLSAREGIEGTYVQVNGGTISISATDDGINAGRKSTSYPVTIEINGGDTTIKMGAGDTDAVDSNGNLYVNGGTINITATSAFDYDGSAKYTAGTIIVNGQTVNTITNQMMGGQGGGAMGGFGGFGGRF